MQLSTEISYARYVQHHRAIEYLRIGWMFSREKPHRHMEQYRFIMIWPCQCRMVEPL